MIRGWLKRRKTEYLDPEYEENLKFVFLLAINMAGKYSERGGYHISKNEAIEFAKLHKVKLLDWQITGRSLLNIDAKGQYKFAHLSIMEVLLARALFWRTEGGGEKLRDWEPTEQTLTFLKEMNAVEKKNNKIIRK